MSALRSSEEIRTAFESRGVTVVERSLGQMKKHTARLVAGPAEKT